MTEVEIRENYLHAYNKIIMEFIPPLQGPVARALAEAHAAALAAVLKQLQVEHAQNANKATHQRGF